MRRLSSLSFFSLSLSVLLGFASAANAQEDADTIVVTATRAPAPINTLPADVTIIDAGAALSQGNATLALALASAPGVMVAPSGGPGQQTSLFLGGANSEHTLVLYDGVRINDAASPKSAFDAGQDLLGGLTRVEIVEGPMSAIYGSDAIGGVVNMISRHGGEGPLNANLDLSAGSFGTAAASAGVGGTLGAFRYALNAEGYSTEGYDLVPERMSTHTGEEDGADLAAISGVFDLALSDAFAVDLLLRHRTATSDFDDLEYAPPTYAEQRVEDEDLQITRNTLDLGRLGATWNLSDALSLRAAYGSLRQDRAQVDDGMSNFRYKGERDFADLTLDWRAGDVGAFSDVALVAGVERQREEVDIYELFDPSFPPASTVAENQDHSGVFITSQAALNRINFTGAVRVDDFEGFGTETTWRVGASYNVAENARVYAAYGTGFRAPTLYERFVSFGDPNLDAEESTSWEIGADAHFAAFGQSSGIELGALYRATDIDNLIAFGPSFSYENIEEAEIKTAEARIGLRPLSWLNARLAYVYTDAQDATTNAQLARRPEQGFNASLEATHGALSSTLSWRQVGERTDFLYGDDGFSIGLGDAPSYELVRLSAAYEFQPGMQVYVAADNLLDEEYEPVNGFAGAERNVMAGLRLRTPR